MLVERFAPGDGDQHTELLISPGYGASSASLIIALLVVFGLVGIGVMARRDGRAARIELPLCASAPLGFLVQELVEHSLTAGHFAPLALLTVTVACGLALQIPVALAAFLLARCVLRVAVAVFARISRSPRIRRPRVARTRPLEEAPLGVSITLSGALRTRGPPRPA